MSRHVPLARAAIAIALPAVLLTGCGSSGQLPAEPGNAGSNAGSAPAEPGGGGASPQPTGGGPNGAPGKAVKPGDAVNLQVSEELRATLGDLYFKRTGSSPGPSGPRSRSQVIGPKSVFYGKVTGTIRSVDTFYALGDTGYTGDPVSQQDGPHVWRKEGTGPWQYIGDTGGSCGGVPEKLTRIWGNACP